MVSHLISMGENFRSIWLKKNDPSVVQIIDQRKLPHQTIIFDITCYQDGIFAIREMLVRGAPLIGATAAWSLYLACFKADINTRHEAIRIAAEEISTARPTAVNLRGSIQRILSFIKNVKDEDLVEALKNEVQAICNEDIEICKSIGKNGLKIIENISSKKNHETVNVLTHCNAGALATINWGTATAPIYYAHQKGIKIHVWVDETRPRNQGSQLTTWELEKNKVPHTLIVDNAGGHIMQRGMVDLCIVGSDRTTRTGDVANKIGTYLKALAAADNNVPFYVALPSTTIDWQIDDGISNIPIEERDPTEVSHIYGESKGQLQTINTVPTSSAISNYAFDITPANLVTGLITEKGLCEASAEGLAELFPDQAKI